MNNREIMTQAAATIEAAGSVALITVISTTGSTPGKTGYKMLVGASDAPTFGTVGGGPVEGEMIEHARTMLARPESRVMQFELTAESGLQRGICGGVVEFLVESFDKRHVPALESLAKAFCSGRAGAAVSVIHPGSEPRRMLVEDLDNPVADCDEDAEVIHQAVDSIRKGHTTAMASAGDCKVFAENLAGPAQLVLFGAGHLSQFIYEYAMTLDFDVTVCDDRAEFANAERFPQACRIVVGPYEELVEKVDCGPDSYIVVVTRGHACDETVLEAAVKTDAKYIGMIGSKRKTLKILENLTAKGVSAELLRRVYSPIGLDIAALTPREIALSIVCELVKIRRAGGDGSADHLTLCSKWRGDGAGK